MAPPTPPPIFDARAYAIFLHARSAVTAVRYPRRLDYTISVSGIDASEPRANHYQASCNPLDGSIRVLPISVEELASPPPHPHDFDFRTIVIQGHAVTVGRPADPDLLGGVPIVEPTYSFGLAFRQAARLQSTAESVEQLPVIAVVSTNARDYDVSLIDTPMFNGELTYHLGLVPRHKPKDLRLRELWVGTNDFLPRQALVSGNFTVAPLVDVPWIVSFDIVDGAPYISHETAEATLYLGHYHVVHDAQIAFDDLREPSGAVVGEPLIAPNIDTNSLIEP